VATHLLPWASEVGFRTVLVEPRSERLREGSWAALADTVVESEAELEVRGELFVVCTDHDAPHLVELLEALLRRGPRHVAVMGSARHTGHHLEALRARGLPDGDVARIESPAGLSIGSRTPAEIAISILAGLIAFRHGAAPAR
jgi:xanthine dehydrogenase accessory factor